MRCLPCGARTRTRRESYAYTGAGLPNVVLRMGKPSERLPRLMAKLGEPVAEYPADDVGPIRVALCSGAKGWRVAEADAAA